MSLTIFKSQKLQDAEARIANLEAALNAAGSIATPSLDKLIANGTIKPKASAPKAHPPIHRANLKPSSSSSAVKQSNLTTAEQFAGKPLCMSRAEFNKLQAFDKMNFVRQGGSLVNA
jgi:hypothetical protein